MRKILTLLAVAMVMANANGCCCRRLCPFLDNGSCCCLFRQPTVCPPPVVAAPVRPHARRHARRYIAPQQYMAPVATVAPQSFVAAPMAAALCPAVCPGVPAALPSAVHQLGPVQVCDCGRTAALLPATTTDAARRPNRFAARLRLYAAHVQPVSVSRSLLQHGIVLPV